MNDKTKNNFNRIRWLSLIFFFAAIFMDWLFIFSISQEADIITHLVIVLPFVLSIFFFFVLVAFFGIYFAQWWGFFIAYLAIVISLIIAIVTFNWVPRDVATGLSYLVIVVLSNIVILGYIAFFQCFSKSA